MENKFNISYAEKWLDKLRIYWLNKDVERVTSLFANTEYYQETPFMQPYTNYDDIVQEWQHIKEQNIKKVEFKILAIDNNVLIVEWTFEENESIYNGIYEVKFNDKLDCIYFKSWEMRK